MKETEHDYQGCLVGNFYDNDCSATFESWEEFKKHIAILIEKMIVMILIILCLDTTYIKKQKVFIN